MTYSQGQLIPRWGSESTNGEGHFEGKQDLKQKKKKKKMELGAISVVDSMEQLLFCKLIAFSGNLDSCMFGRHNPAMEWHFKKGTITGTNKGQKCFLTTPCYGNKFQETEHEFFCKQISESHVNSIIQCCQTDCK